MSKRNSDVPKETKIEVESAQQERRASNSSKKNDSKNILPAEKQTKTYRILQETYAVIGLVGALVGLMFLALGIWSVNEYNKIDSEACNCRSRQVLLIFGGVMLALFGTVDIIMGFVLVLALCLKVIWPCWLYVALKVLEIGFLMGVLLSMELFGLVPSIMLAIAVLLFGIYFIIVVLVSIFQVKQAKKQSAELKESGLAKDPSVHSDLPKVNPESPENHEHEVGSKEAGPKEPEKDPGGHMHEPLKV